MHELRTRTAVAGVICVALLVSGCSALGSTPTGSTNGSGSSTSGSSGLANAVYRGPVGRGEGHLNVLAWPGYAEDGSTDPNVDWVTPFEKATGCKVTVTSLGSSDDAVTRLQKGGFDVLSASGDVTLRLVEGDLVQPINTDLVPNYKDIVSDLKLQSFNSVSGVPYGIPQGRGANLLMYNTKQVTPAPDSWAPTFASDSPYKGHVTAYDSPIVIADAAVYLMATHSELGIKDPYSLDQTQFDAAVALLQQQKPLVGAYWSDPPAVIKDFASGTTTIGSSWQVIQSLANAEGAPVAVVKPKEGATGWSDTWMVAKDAKNVNCAYKWLDWIASPKVNAEAAEWLGQAPANSKACALTRDPSFCTTYHANDAKYWKDVHYWTTPSAACLDGRTDVRCVPYPEWAKAWSTVRSG